VTCQAGWWKVLFTGRAQYRLLESWIVGVRVGWVGRLKWNGLRRVEFGTTCQVGWWKVVFTKRSGAGTGCSGHGLSGHGLDGLNGLNGTG
jgi:hypothetical protein